MSRQGKFSALLKTPSSSDDLQVDESSTAPASEAVDPPAKVAKPRRRPATRPAPAQPDPETAGKGKRARGYVNLGFLLPIGLRDDLRVAVSLDPERRDLSELCSDLISDYLDTLPAGYQNIRPSRRMSESAIETT
jgi:hypothetical protein